MRKYISFCFRDIEWNNDGFLCDKIDEALNVGKFKYRVKVGNGMDLTSAESKATYKQIQNYVMEKFRCNV